MTRELVSKYQLSGVDERDRGFSRQITLKLVNGQYVAVLRYEQMFIETNVHKDESLALKDLIQNLHQIGYTQLQTQRSFSGDTYLGTQEACIEYPDPETQQTTQRSIGIVSRVLRRLGLS